MIAGDEPKTRRAAADSRVAKAPRRPSLLRLLVRAVAAGAVAAAAMFVLGFVWFAERIARDEVAIPGKADGIVALTGGAFRVTDAVDLLAAGRGHRLLITGVNPATNAHELARRVPAYERLFACCIDLDHSAMNTIGNAMETRRWSSSHGFRSLLVVTSNYHMPRALAELAHRLPEVELIPFPVVNEKRSVQVWWSSAATARLLVSEYVKYILAVVRMQIEPAADAIWAVAARAGAKS
jgi:uncharacterized SAM-binding protein YcdF (DUF218 family)